MLRSRPQQGTPYAEKAHFTRVFKKNTGQTPTEFREEMRKLVA